ncbi:MAG: RNA polymerase sigma factor, partial [Actinomycetota bacterium]|nr:RNA polymerase sigma factor [Actinomycetota bacterium]
MRLESMRSISDAEPYMTMSERRASGRLARLYERHAPEAVRLAYLLIGDRQGAEDIAQDAFVKVAGRFHDLRHPDAFRPYLRRAVVNLCNSHFRRKTVERAFLRREAAVPLRTAELP